MAMTRKNLRVCQVLHETVYYDVLVAIDTDDDLDDILQEWALENLGEVLNLPEELIYNKDITEVLTALDTDSFAYVSSTVPQYLPIGRTAGMSGKEIATFALGGKIRGLHHTTDFPLLLMDTVNRTLLAQYAIQERTFTAWARRATMNDFRTVTRARLSELLGDLEKVREGEEYKYGTFSEGGESYKLVLFSCSIFSITGVISSMVASFVLLSSERTRLLMSA